MRKPLTIANLRQAIDTRIAKVQQTISAFQGSQHPQVRDMWLKSSGELEDRLLPGALAPAASG